MAVDLGKGYVQIIPSAKGISGAISNELNGAAGKAGKTSGLSIVKGIKGILVKAAIGATIIKTIKSAVSEGAKLEQSMGGIEALYGEKAAKIVIKNSQTAFKRAGMSANEYMETATSFSAALLKSVGGNGEKAAKAADQIMVDMSDNMNRFGTDIEDIEHAYKGLAKGQYNMLDNLQLGYGGSKQGLEELIADAEKWSNQKFDISNFNDVAQAIHVVQEHYKIAGTTAKEATTTISGSFGMMKAAWTDLLGNLTLGRDIGQSMKNLVDTAVIFLGGNLVPALGRILMSLPPALISGIQALAPYVAEGFNSLFNSITRFNSWNLESLMNNMFGAGQGFGNIIAKFFDDLPSVMSSLGGKLTTMFQALGPIVVQAVRGLFLGLSVSNLGESATTFATNLFNGLQTAIMGLIPKMGSIAILLVNGFFNNFPKAAELAAQMWTNISNALVDIINKITAFADNMGDSSSKVGGDIVKNFVAGLIKNLPKIVTGIAKLALAMTKGIMKINLAIGRLLLTLAKNMLKGGLNAALGFVKGIGSGLAGLAGKVAGWIKGALSPITNFVSRVKSLFPLNIGKIFSNLKVPHINISGGKAPYGIGGLGTKPKIDIEWYAKGGIVDGATLIGVGEKGAEAIVPLDPLWNRLDQMQMGQTYNINMTVEAHDLEDLMTMEQFIDMLQRAKQFA